MLPEYPDLNNKKILVTGASSGIGRQVAVALAKQGCELYITGRNLKELEKTKQLSDAKAFIIPCDLTCAKQQDELVKNLPSLDGVCHSAGIINPFPLSFLNEAQFDKVFNINAKSPILLTASLLRRKKFNYNASIVFISSIASDRAMKGGAVYSTSKAAVEAFSRCITLEHASNRIRSNCVKPGLTKTNIFDQANALSVATGADNWLDDYEKLYPLGIGEPGDVAAAVLYLLSNASGWVTGTTLTLDGGLSTRI